MSEVIEQVEPHPQLVCLARAVLALTSTRRRMTADVMRPNASQCEHPQLVHMWDTLVEMFDRAEANDERRLLVAATSGNVVDAETCAEALAVMSTALLDALAEFTPESRYLLGLVFFVETTTPWLLDVKVAFVDLCASFAW